MQIRSLLEEDFDDVIRLGNAIHGKGYLTKKSLLEMFKKGIKHGINAHAIATKGEKVIGFRLTYSPGNWNSDEWCSPKHWDISSQEVCYFKTNNVLPEWRGNGVGHLLLQHSINAVKQQGAIAGVAHIWKESPNNSSVRYFSKAGAKLIKEHPKRWSWENYDDNYDCAHCGGNCHCTACEMLLEF
ncbi:GNAT family N-acetyltransferase [Shewanella sp. OPT22]|nr:GNAT family N-acetyltransferase [Shewanella sp. OPT22]